ncbi:MAG: IclR family transcriptional regulator [Chloroflexota bacterium]
MAETYPGTQAVIRAIRLLKLFGQKQSYLTLTEAVEMSGLNKTTAFRLLGALQSEGLLERTETNDYRLGPELVALGGRAMQHNSLIRVAEPIMNRLMNKVNERVTLEQPIVDPDEGLSMLLLNQVHSTHLIGVNQLYGTRMAIHATSTGKAYMAYLERSEISAILSKNLLTYTPQTLTGYNDLMEELSEVRQKGYAVALGELETGLLAVGAPLFNHLGKPIAAISIEAPDSRNSEERLHQMAIPLKAAAAEISYKLGYR